MKVHRIRWRAGLIVAALAVLFEYALVVAQSPEPSPFDLLPGDVRSADAPGITGGPLEILLLVVALGAITAALTVLAAKLLGRRRPREDEG
ncbi:MAG: hypothetical protein ACC726_12070 [Chloroflexota bacterium]